MKNPFRKSREPEQVPDAKLSFFEVDPSIREQIEALQGIKENRPKVKAIIRPYLEGLNRAQLLCVQEDEWFKAQDKRFDYALNEEYSEVEWRRDWPIGNESEDRIREIMNDEINIIWTGKQRLDMDALVKRIDGIQKKIDKVHAFVEAIEEVSMSGKTVFKLMNL